MLYFFAAKFSPVHTCCMIVLVPWEHLKYSFSADAMCMFAYRIIAFVTEKLVCFLVQIPLQIITENCPLVLHKTLPVTVTESFACEASDTTDASSLYAKKHTAGTEDGHH